MVTEELQGLRDSGKILHYDRMLRCYAVTGSRGEKITYRLSTKHPSTVMFRYGYMRVTRVRVSGKILYYDQMLRCYGVTDCKGEKITYSLSTKHPSTVMFRYCYMRVTRVTGLWKTTAL